MNKRYILLYGLLINTIVFLSMYPIILNIWTTLSKVRIHFSAPPKEVVYKPIPTIPWIASNNNPNRLFVGGEYNIQSTVAIDTAAVTITSMNDQMVVYVWTHELEKYPYELRTRFTRSPEDFIDMINEYHKHH